MLQYIPIYYTGYVRTIKIQKYLQFVSQPSSDGSLEVSTPWLPMPEATLLLKHQQ